MNCKLNPESSELLLIIKFRDAADLASGRHTLVHSWQPLKPVTSNFTQHN